MKNNKKNINELITKKGYIKKKYIPFVDKLNHVSRGKKWYLKYYSGSGRKISTYSTRYHQAIEFLDSLNVPYTLGNDAPRGGAVGDYIEFTRKVDKRTIAKLQALCN